MISKQVTYVCSDHFIAEDYSHGTKRKFLKEDVSPTVFNEEYKEMENVSREY